MALQAYIVMLQHPVTVGKSRLLIRRTMYNWMALHIYLMCWEISNLFHILSLGYSSWCGCTNFWTDQLSLPQMIIGMKLAKSLWMLWVQLRMIVISLAMLLKTMLTAKSNPSICLLLMKVLGCVWFGSLCSDCKQGQVLYLIPYVLHSIA